MSKGILQSIINEFDIEKFIKFFRSKNDKLRHPDEVLDYGDAENNFAEGRKLAEGKLDDGEFIVCSFLVKKGLTERSGKKAQYILGKKILREEQADAGIFIFYDPQGKFRFSLIYTNYLGKRRDWSNFRRFTYFVSRELTNKTFLQRIGEGDFSTLEKIKDAFSVEKVTKEFYIEIANWYFWAVREAKFPPDAEKEENGRNIAVIRLITRMIFIWFMKVRNLIPNELFNINNIKEILKDLSSNKSTYYRAILQNLFFATLNTRQEERKFRTEIRGYKGYNPDFGNHSVYRYHSLFKNPEKMEEYFKNIPFLNGGLFDCLDYKSKKKEERFYIDGFTDTKQHQPYVPNFLFFTEDEKNIDLNQEYGTKGKRYKVRGLINILSSYNFTIDENEPDDFEVALDPELLGRVFENLLASYNPETATTARKATGSYNTPREIVDYMVTQSLINYFKTHLSDVSDIDDKLTQLFSKEKDDNPFDGETTKRLISLVENLRVVDPAVGSGAFPMGILNKLVFTLSKLDPQNILWEEAQIDAVYKNVKDPVLQNKFILQIEKQFQEKNPDYGRKLYLIEKCIYGVDIQQIAVEIAKLRFFISLLVDEKIDPDKPNFGIEPLPNLDFKLMQGNSLISSFAGIDFGKIENKKDKVQTLFVSTTKYDELIKQFEHTKNQYQNEPDKEKKDKLREKIETLLLEIFEEKLNEHLPEFRKIEEQASTLPNPEARKNYIAIEKQRLAKKLGFDLEQAQKELIAYTEGRKTKNFFLWDVYFAEVFTGENPGFDIVIGNPPYIKEYTFRKAFDGLRESPYYKGKMDIWYLFACKGIDLLKKNLGVLTFIAQNNWVTSYGASKMRNKVIKDTQIIQMLDFGSYMIFEHSDIQTMVMIFKLNSEIDNYKFDYRRLEGDDLNFNDVLDLLNYNQTSKTVYLKPTIQRNKFIDKPLIFSSTKIDSILNKLSEQSNFKLSKDEVVQGIVAAPDKYFIVNDLSKFNDEERSFIKPFYTSTARYFKQKTNRYLIYLSHKNFKGKNINDFSNIKNHFTKYKSQLQRAKIKYGTPQKPYFYVHRERDEYFFKKGPKIAGQTRTFLPCFLYTEDEYYGSRAMNFIKTDRVNLKYLVALLNSTLIFFWLKHKGKRLGEMLHIDKEPLLALPLKSISNYDQQPFIILVDKILAITKDDDYLENPIKQAKVREYEKQIDQLVYKLYGLTEEEIKLVEGERK